MSLAKFNDERDVSKIMRSLVPRRSLRAQSTSNYGQNNPKTLPKGQINTQKRSKATHKYLLKTSLHKGHKKPPVKSGDFLNI